MDYMAWAPSKIMDKRVLEKKVCQSTNSKGRWMGKRKGEGNRKGEEERGKCVRVQIPKVGGWGKGKMEGGSVSECKFQMVANVF